MNMKTKLLTALLGGSLLAGNLMAQIIFSETFDGLNTGNLAGQAGWSYTGGSATGTAEHATVAAGGLSYSGGTVSHSAGTNKLSLFGGGESRFAITLPNTIAAGETFYVSFLINHVGSGHGGNDHFTWLGIGGGATDQASSVSFALQNNNHRTRVVDTAPQHTQAQAANNLIPDQTRLVVAEIFFGGDTANSTMTMYLDPTSLIQSENTVNHVNAGRNIGVTELNTLWFRKGNNNGRTDIDQIRIGESWEAVVIPEPGTLVLFGIAVGSVFLFRRRR